MWISNPIPETTRIISDESGSRRRVNGTLKSPDAIQLKNGCVMTRASGSSRTSVQTAATDTTNDPAIAAQAADPAKGLLIRRPKLAFSRKPRNGNSGIRRSIKCNHEDTKTRKNQQSLLRDFVFSWLSFS